jgi:hypothetical protein
MLPRRFYPILSNSCPTKKVSLTPKIPHAPWIRNLPKRKMGTLVPSRNENTVERHLQTRNHVLVSKALHKMTMNAPFTAGTNG